MERDTLLLLACTQYRCRTAPPVSRNATHRLDSATTTVPIEWHSPIHSCRSTKTANFTLYGPTWRLEHGNRHTDRPSVRPTTQCKAIIVVAVITIIATQLSVLECHQKQSNKQKTDNAYRAVRMIVERVIRCGG